MKVRPSMTEDGKVEGAILALTDIDALLRSQENRRRLETSLRSLLKDPPDLLLAATPAGQTLFMGSLVLAETRGAGLNRSIFEYLAPQDRGPMRLCMSRALEDRIPVELEVRKFKLIEVKGPVVLRVEPIVTKEGVLALGVRMGVKDKAALRVRSADSPRGAGSATAATS